MVSTLYHCPHLSLAHPPPPPLTSSSSYSFSPLTSLYFCEECDAVRCDQCVAVEVASYFCPNCLFDVPSANIRGDKNRCARSCFACPTCSTSLSILASETAGELGAPYLLACPGCKWSSKSIGWEFEKPTGLALQLQKLDTSHGTLQTEFDSLKDHLESYVSLATPQPNQPSRNPSRHISHLTQMAAKALHRDLPGMAASSAKRRIPRGVDKGGAKERIGWDELTDYKGDQNWKQLGVQRGLEDVENMRRGEVAVASLERRWGKSWETDRSSSSQLPTRIPLQPKLTKRCPHPTCRHLLIQPDSKGVRMKIKMVAVNYLPTIDIGRRRRRMASGNLQADEDKEMRRRDRKRGQEVDEELSNPLVPGETYSFQLAFTNPLYDPIQIKLSPSPTPSAHTLHLSTPHFTVSPLKDAWAYDEEDEAEEPDEEMDGMASFSRSSRLSSLMLGGGSGRERKSREGDVEKKGNTSKVAFEVEIAAGIPGSVQFDLEVRYTYRADEEDKDGKDKKVKEEFKHFSFWIRINVGEVAE